MNQAIVVISAGTAEPEAEQRAIGAVERALAARFPGWTVRRAYTGEGILRIKRARGEQIDSLPEALERLRQEGARQVCVASAHIFAGAEYRRAVHALSACPNAFDSLAISSPLVACEADAAAVGNAVLTHNPIDRDEWLVLAAHGGASCADAVEAAERAMRARVCERIAVGTLSSARETAARLASLGCHRAKLSPLMLTAGRHIQSAFQAGEQSWTRAFEAAGIETEPILRGLGEYEEIRALCCAHTAAACGAKE